MPTNKENSETSKLNEVGCCALLARENAFLRDLSHDLAVELYSSQKIETGSNAERLIKMAMKNLS